MAGAVAEVKNAAMDLLSLKYLLCIQVEMSGRQLAI